MTNELINLTKQYFSFDYCSDDFLDNWQKYRKEVESIIHDYGWNAVLDSWYSYLKNECLENDALIRFAHLFFTYTDFKRPVGNPFDFLAIFYSRMGNPLAVEDGDIIDDMALSLIENAGYERASQMVDPYYDPINDPDLQKAIEKFEKNGR